MAENHKKAAGRLCYLCNQRRAALKRPKTLEQVNSFFLIFFKLTIFSPNLQVLIVELAIVSFVVELK